MCQSSPHIGVSGAVKDTVSAANLVKSGDAGVAFGQRLLAVAAASPRQTAAATATATASPPASAAAASAAAASAAAPAAAASAAAASAAASCDLYPGLKLGCIFLVEDIERAQADVGELFVAQRDFVI